MLDNNTITGSTNFLCGENMPATFIADCLGDSPLVNCSCCTLCCDDEGPECNGKGLLAEFDPTWKDNYQRPSYSNTGAT